MSKLSSWKTIFFLCVFCAVAAIGSPAQTFTTLVSFNGTNGALPYAMSLIQGTNGDLYGTTEVGGAHGEGTVFKITLSGTLTTLYSFCAKTGCTDGIAPLASLVLATDGNFYGATWRGGASNDGTIFKITAGGTLTTLHSFDGADGSNPTAALVQATNGNFYGTTNQGGANSCPFGTTCGTVFKITLGGAMTTLHNFDGTDGQYPNGLVQASDGNFYGTTLGGGAHGGGTVFKITAGGTLTTLYSFCAQTGCTDGYGPYDGLIQATNGSFYGTTAYGGAGNVGACNEGGGIGWGTIFEITPGGKLTTLHRFDDTDGSVPDAELVQATNGNFYGTTACGGNNGAGTVFEITPGGTVITLHSFQGSPPVGAGTEGGLVQDTNGTFYGTTTDGGTSGNCTNGCGTVFSLSVGLGPFMETQPTSGKEGAKIGILGQGFSSSSVVKFGGTKATTVVLSGTTFITATVPAGALTGAVTVTTGTTTLTSPQTFKVLPTIASFSPTSGPVGTSVTLKGTGLKQTTKVTFDGKSAAFTVDSDTQVTADVPTGAATGKIAVTTKGGSATSATSFTVN